VVAALAIVTDSIACLPPDSAADLDVCVVPVRIIHRGQVLRDELDVTLDEVFEWQQRGQLVSTSQPSVGDFVEAYRRLAAHAEAIVSIHVSAAMTGVYQSARLAASLVPEVPIRVIDSQAATIAEGFLVLEAARMARAGATLDEIERFVLALRPRIRFFAVLDTVKHLVRSGRAPLLASLAVDVLQIKPILTLLDGRIVMLARARTRRRALRAMVERMARDVGHRPVRVAVFHAAAQEEAERLRSEVVRRFKCRECLLVTVTPAMGLYTGPGLLGLAYYTDLADR
jgi:DegV family protein with EDD domain